VNGNRVGRHPDREREFAWQWQHLAAFVRSLKVAQAVASQLRDALGPFNRYLQSSVRMARKRQVRLELPWSLVPEEKRLRVEPLDTLVKIPIRPPRWRIRGWREQPVLDQPLIFVEPPLGKVEPLETERDGMDLVLHLSPDVTNARQVFWRGEPVTLEFEGAGETPTEVCGVDGQVRRVLYAKRYEDRWLLTIEGPGFRPAEGEVLDALQHASELRDERDRRFKPCSDAPVETEPEGVLRSPEGVRFAAKLQTVRKGRGVLVQLELPEENDGEELIDPRARFCEADPEEVWTDRRYHPERVIRVLQVDRENYRLRLERQPDARHEPRLFLPLDVRHLELQRRALHQLRTAPLPHMQGLVRLCEDPKRARWPRVGEEWPDRWFVLTDESRSGTNEQRRFVARALGTPDLAVMEGPPGSGKTTVVVELALQLASRGERVLFVSNTNVAVDNVVERLLAQPDAPETVRVGNPERIDHRAQQAMLDRKVDALLEAWCRKATFADLSEDALRRAATRTVMDAAEVVCVTMGSLPNLPMLREAARRDDRDWSNEPWARPIVWGPVFDVLIVDEASKTLVPEFLLAALLARKHVIVGDVRQLPPFADRDALEANLEALVTETEEGERETSLASPERQRAALIRFYIEDRRWWDNNAVRFLVAEPEGVLDGLSAELEGRVDDVVRIRRRKARGGAGVLELGLNDVIRGEGEALALLAAKVVLVPTELLEKVAPHLPGDLQPLFDPQKLVDTPLPFRMAWWENHAPSMRAVRVRGQELRRPADVGRYLADMAARRTWAAEVAWRVQRRHELRMAGQSRERNRLSKELTKLMPRELPGVEEAIQDVADVGLPSVLEVIQIGLRGERTRRTSGLVEGMTQGAAKEAFEERFVRLTYQHRMHPELSAVPRSVFYANESLQDANTIEARDRDAQWDWAPQSWSNKRLVWIDVSGRESRGVNEAEVKAALAVVEDFADWAARREAPPASTHPGKRWTVALLSFYSRQERRLADRMRECCRQPRRHTRFEWPKAPVEIVVGTVDRFQGREADLVVLSFRNTGRVGFLDSPNRLNVAITRARQQLVLIGRYDFFQELEDVRELAALARSSERVPSSWRPGHGC